MWTRGIIPLAAVALAVTGTVIAVGSGKSTRSNGGRGTETTKSDKAQTAGCTQPGCEKCVASEKGSGCCEADKIGAECKSEPCKECLEGEKLLAETNQLAQGPPFGRGQGFGRGGRGRGPGHGRDEKFAEDHNVFFFLLEHGEDITRSVKNLPNGIETVTESDNPEVAAKIQEHVAAMYERIENVNPIHMRDPLFRELFANAKKIKMEMKDTENGVRVVETSDDTYVAKLLQEHAKVVSLFIKNGRAELHRNHTLPPREAASVTIDGVEWHALPTHAPAPKDNPTTDVRVELGKKLYFDPRLSLTGTVSCNSCHNVMEGGDDGRPSSMGILGRIGPRNAPTVWNSAFQNSQFWDGRSPSLEDQAKGPLLAPPEMGMLDHDAVVDRIRAVPGYIKEFEVVFGKDALNIENAAKAIAAFERTLITPNSPYDQFVGGDKDALTEQQARGMKLFDSVGCTECHSGPAFNGWTADSTEPVFFEFPRDADNPYVKKYKLTEDVGRFVVTKNSEDKHRFKTHTLRNATLTAPYFHNGAVDSLSEAVRVMASTQLDAELTDANVADIVAFLSALEGEFPEIAVPRLPSDPGETILKNQAPANVGGK